MPIVGGFPSSYAEVVWSEPLHHTRLWVTLAELCAIDLFPAVRYEDCEVLRSVVDCSVLEIPPLDLTVKEKLLRLLGKKNLEAGLFGWGLAGSRRKTNSCLNLRTWSMLLVMLNLVVRQVVGKLNRFVGLGVGNKIKGFLLGWFIPKPKLKEMMEVSKVTGPVLDLEACHFCKVFSTFDGF
jgi:hypothetical protein